MNLSDDGDVQRAEAALQLAAFSLRSRSRGEEEENDDDCMPPELLPVSRGVDKGSPEGGDRNAGASGEEEDGNKLAVALDAGRAGLSPGRRLVVHQARGLGLGGGRGQRMGCYG